MTLDLTRAPQTDPLEIYRYRDGIYAVDMLITGLVHLDIFTWLSQHPSDLSAICAAHGFATRPADVMMTFLAANGFVSREGGIFRVTPLASEHLVKGSPFDLGPYYASLKDRPVCQDLLTVLRTDKPSNWGSSKKTQEWTKAMETDEFATEFTAAMDCRGAYLGQAMAGKLNLTGHSRLLDIGGGSGIYACAIAAAHPHLHATVLDKPPVDRIAQTMIVRRGFDARMSVVAGDMFQDTFPANYDVHLISNVLHDWDFPKVRQILANSFASLPPGGLLVIHDAHLNADKTGPLPVAAYSVILMHSTEGRCYSVREMESLLKDAGFGEIEFTYTAADRSIMTARKRR